MSRCTVGYEAEIDGEYPADLLQMVDPMDERLMYLIDQIEAKYPAICYKEGGSRARQAADIVDRKQIDLAGHQHGRDYWRIGHYTTSIRGGNCTCMDNAPQDDNGGKLCKHRIAAMFVVKLDGMKTLTLERIIREAGADELTLHVDVLFADAGPQYTLAGYKYPSRAAVTLEYAERIKFTERQLTDALNATGWTIAQRPTKQRGYMFHYYLARIESLPGTAPAWTLAAASYEQVEWKEQAARFKELQTVNDMIGEFADEAERELA